MAHSNDQAHAAMVPCAATSDRSSKRNSNRNNNRDSNGTAQQATDGYDGGRRDRAETAGCPSSPSGRQVQAVCRIMDRLRYMLPCIRTTAGTQRSNSADR